LAVAIEPVDAGALEGALGVRAGGVGRAVVQIGGALVDVGALPVDEGEAWIALGVFVAAKAGGGEGRVARLVGVNFMNRPECFR
jgi:hypothetical protein